MGVDKRIDYLEFAPELTDIEIDCLGIGFGPGNIGLAVAMEEAGFSGSAFFLERLPAPDWQPEMLLEGSDIQHHPLRDFATPRDPGSRFGFLHYLKAQGRLFEFFNLDAPHPPRLDYARYIRWVARHFDRLVGYGEAASGIAFGNLSDGSQGFVARTSRGRRVRARSVVLAPGRTPHVPEAFEPFLGDRIVHFTRYLSSLARWKAEGRTGRIAVIGASQSAAEIVLDLHAALPRTQIINLFRGFSYQLKDTSPFTERIYFPEFVDHFHAASDAARSRMTREMWRSNYGSADHDVISQLYLKRYNQLVSGREGIRFEAQRSVDRVSRTDDGGVRLHCIGPDEELGEQIDIDAVILATGFKNFGHGIGFEPFHPLLAEIAPACRRLADGSLAVSRDYRLEPASADHPLPPLFLNGLCESTHGFGDAGSFSLLSMRSSTLLDGITAALTVPALGVA
jgi:L-ornithine N5-oxygenase